MDPVRDLALVVAALLIGAGLVLAAVLELSAADRRLVGRARDTVEVLLPPALTVLLVGAVWSSFGF